MRLGRGSALSSRKEARNPSFSVSVKTLLRFRCYHEYLRQLCEEYVQGGGLEAAYTRIRGQIDALMAEDPTAFCTYEQFDAAASSLKTAIELRAESVLGQLNGDIPSTREGQEAEPEKLLDVSGADLSGLTGRGGWGGGILPGGK